MPLSVRYVPPKVDARLVLAAAAEGAVEIAGKMLLDASQELVPVDTGELKASGKVEADGPHRAKVSYQATSPEGYDYAVRQHEDLTLNHPRGGQAKYLETPLHSEGPAIAHAMAEALRAVM